MIIIIILFISVQSQVTFIYIVLHTAQIYSDYSVVQLKSVECLYCKDLQVLN